MKKITTLAAIMAVFVLAVTVALSGTAAADNHADHSVSIETETLTTNTTERVEVTITNDDGDSNMVSPLIEIPLRSGLSVADENRSVISGTEFIVDSNGDNLVTVESESGLDETRSAFIDDSTLRNGDAVFVEGEEVPVGDSRTYGIPLDISGSSEITVEADTRPLNFEEQNNRTETTIDPIAEGTITVQSVTEATITGAGTARTVEGAETGNDVNLPGNQTYTVNTTLSNPIGKLSVDDIELEEFENQPIEFTDPNPSGTLSPTVVARTGGQASVIDGSSSRDTALGTAETKTTQTVTFDLSVSGGQTILAVGTQSALPMENINGVPGTTDQSFENGVAQLDTNGAVDETLSVTFEGRRLGDVNADETVDSDDAVEIADALAAGNSDSLTAYADVTESDSISAVDAMQIQQYTENNRTADYVDVVDGGN